MSGAIRRGLPAFALMTATFASIPQSSMPVVSLTLKSRKNRHNAIRDGVFGVERRKGGWLVYRETGFKARSTSDSPVVAGFLRIGVFVYFRQTDLAC